MNNPASKRRHRVGAVVELLPPGASPPGHPKAPKKFAGRSTKKLKEMAEVLRIEARKREGLERKKRANTEGAVWVSLLREVKRSVGGIWDQK